MLSFLFLSILDASSNYQLGFQDPGSVTMSAIVWFHNFIMVFIMGILATVFFVIFVAVQEFNYDTLKEMKEEGKNKNMLNPYVSHMNTIFAHDTKIEVIWTIVPAVVLMIIAVPSFALLYSMEEVVRPDMTLRVVGHQWYWSYEYPDLPEDEEGVSIQRSKGDISSLNVDLSSGAVKHTFVSKEENGVFENALVSVDMSKATPYGFDSYMLSQDDIGPGMFRLLEVDKRVVLPVNSHIRVLVTSADVLHSWAVPSLGVKVDACPGRINQASLFIKREGIYYGQCSEICGVNHGFMPIAIRAVSKGEYLRAMNLPRWYGDVNKSDYKSIYVKSF